MTVYIAASAATVFATGSFQGNWGLDDYNSPIVRPALLNPAVQQITRTVLARFLNNRPPVAKPGGPSNGLTGQAVQFSGTGSTDTDGTISSYQWNFGDNTTGSGSSPAHTYSAAGVYTVTLTVTDNRGATGTASTTATVAVTTTLRPVADARVRDSTVTTNYGTDVELRARVSSSYSDYRS